MTKNNAYNGSRTATGGTVPETADNASEGHPDASRKARRAKLKDAGRKTRSPWQKVFLGIAALGLAGLLAVGCVTADRMIFSSQRADVAQAEAIQGFTQKLENKKTAAPAPAPKTATPAKDAKPVAPAAQAEPAPTLPADPAPGETYGIIRIPALGAGWEKPLVEGYEGPNHVNENQALLDTLGIVHYGATAQPGAAGNFAVSGHRFGYGNALENLPNLKLGDTATVQTLEHTYTYKVIRTAQEFDPAVVKTIAALKVAESFPPKDKKDPPRKLMTMTTCEDLNAAKRISVVLELVA